MPSYSQYKRQMATIDADDANIETWITVKGNHIPIMKGQSKEEAVQSFLEKKGKSTGGEKKASAEKPAKAPKTVKQLKKAATNLESDPAYHYERADRLSDMIKQREKELENPNISKAMKNTIERGIGELQLAISKHWDAAGKLEKAAREKAKSANKGWQNARSGHPETIGKVVRRVVKKMGEARKKNND